MEDKPSLKVGSEFKSYEDLQEAIDKYQDEHFVLYAVRRSNSFACEALKYANIKYECKHFGQGRDNPNLTLERPKQKVYKIDCESYFYVSRSAKKKTLVVREFHEEHNHPCNKVTYACYPKIRRLSADSVKTAIDMQRVNVKPTLIRPMLREQEGDTIILSRDVSNIRTKYLAMERDGRSDEEMLTAKLEGLKKKDPGALGHIEVDESQNAVFILIQTSEMRQVLQKFPEVLLTDITYKINTNRMPVSVIEVMNGYGLGEVVAYAFLANELKETLTKMLNKFVSASGEEHFRKTQCVIVDKDYSEIGAIRAAMPNAEIHICGVHAEKAMKEAAKGEAKKELIIKAVKGMLHSENEESFQKHYTDLQKVASDEYMKYFNKNWYELREKWSLKDRALILTLKNHTTNRVESHNQKLKMIFGPDTTLYKAVDGIINILQGNKRDDMIYRNHEAITKRVIIHKCSDPIVQVICNELTDYAAQIVCEQYQRSKRPSPFPEKYNVSTDACDCVHFRTMGLSCRHVMRVRRTAGLPVYQKDKVLCRWWKEYNLRVDDEAVDVIALPAMETQIENIPGKKPRMPAEPVDRILSPVTKHKKWVPLSTKLSNLMKECGTKVFHHRFQTIVDVVEYFEQGIQVEVLPLVSGPNRKPLSVVDVTEGANEDLGAMSDIAAEEETQEVTDQKPIIQFDSSNPEIVTIVDSSDESDNVAEGIECNGTSQSKTSGTFNLNKVPRRGRHRGMGDTVHDGTKKPAGRLKKTLPNNVGDNGNQTFCSSEKSAHSKVQDKVSFKLPVAKPKGSSKETTRKEGKSKWNFSMLADECAPLCCICHKECGNHRCCKCNCWVHPHLPCSSIASNATDDLSDRCCNYCAVNLVDDSMFDADDDVFGTIELDHITRESHVAAASSSMTASMSPSPANKYNCFGCGQCVEKRITKRGKNEGREYFCCPTKETDFCKGVFFWAPTPKTSATNGRTSFTRPSLINAINAQVEGAPSYNETSHGGLVGEENLNLSPTLPIIDSSHACVMCMTKGPPSENSAHKCAICSTPVHAFGCSVANEEGEEGFGGSDRVCLACAKTGKRRMPCSSQSCAEVVPVLKKKAFERSEKVCKVCRKKDMEALCTCVVCTDMCHLSTTCSFAMDYFEKPEQIPNECIRVCKLCICSTCKQPQTVQHRCACVVCKQPIFKVLCCVNCRQPIHIEQCSEAVRGTADSRWCLNCLAPKSLSLRRDDILTIKSMGMLSGDVIAVAMDLLHEQYPSIEGLAPPIPEEDVLVRVPPPGEEHRTYLAATKKAAYLQIMYTGHNHWLTAFKPKNIDDKIFVLNSTGAEGIGSFIEQQLALIMAVKQSDFLVSFCKVKRQEEGTAQCGPLAIAFATELAFNSDQSTPHLVDFLLPQLYPHLLKCLVQRKMEPFPRQGSEVTSTVSKSEKIEVFCSCRLPAHFDKRQVYCSVCRNWFHYICEGLEKPPDQRRYTCTKCRRK